MLIALMAINRLMTQYQHLPKFWRWSLGYWRLRVRLRLGANELACLARALTFGRLDCTRYLIENADVNFKRFAGAYMILAISSGDLESVRYLVSIGRDPLIGLDIAWAVTAAGAHIPRYLCALGDNICAGNNVCVRRAVQKGQFDLAHYFLLRGAPRSLAAEFRWHASARDRADRRGRERAARRLYLRWVPLCYRLDRRSGRRARGRNFRDYLRIKH